MGGQKLRIRLSSASVIGVALLLGGTAPAQSSVSSVNDQARLLPVLIQNVDGGPPVTWQIPEDVAAFTRTNWTKYIVGRGQACALLAEALLVVDQVALGKFWAWYYSVRPGYSAPGAPACVSGAYLEVDLSVSLKGVARDPQVWMQQLIGILGPQPASGSKK